MKLTVLISIINLVIACGGSNEPNTNGGSNKSKATSAIVSKDTLYTHDPSRNGSFCKTVTITISHAAIECGCPQWFETKFKNVKFLKGVERFYLEPVGKDLVNANNLWDGTNLPLTLKITGRFSKEKALPITYRTKGEPERARIFWYDKIVVVSPR